MMKCGHAANAKCRQIDGKNFDPPIPSCAICGCIELAPEAPNLTGRIAKCAYRECRVNLLRRRGSSGYGAIGGDGRSFAPSSPNLPFFEHKPDQPHDTFYCGCLGWD
jgi:hypothetical protein